MSSVWNAFQKHGAADKPQNNTHRREAFHLQPVWKEFPIKYKTFLRDIKTHLKTHPGKETQCSGKTFVELGHIKTHLLNHSEENRKPFNQFLLHSHIKNTPEKSCRCETPLVCIVWKDF